MKNNFCKIVRIPNKDSQVFFVVSKNKTLHPGDKLFIENICLKLNSNIELKSSSSIPIYISLRKHSLSITEEYGLLLDWSKSIFLSPEIEILLTLKKFDFDIDPFKQIRNNSLVMVNKEIASSRLRTFGLFHFIEDAENILRSNNFVLEYIGKDKKNKGYNNSITGFDNCKKHISDKNPDAILTFDNYWMHYGLSKNINCFVVQRRKFQRMDYKNHVFHLNRLCGKSIYMIN